VTLSVQQLLDQDYSPDQAKRMAAILATRAADLQSAVPRQPGSSARGPGWSAPSERPSRSPSQWSAVREWCLANNVPVSTRGAVGRASWEAYERARH
jgi:hypothetical protein